MFSNGFTDAKTTLWSWVENCQLRWGGVINKQALKDSTAVLQIQQGTCNSCSPYQGAICYWSKHAEVSFLSVRVTVACVFLVCVVYLYLAWTWRYFYMTRESEKKSLHFLHHQPYQIGYEKNRHIFCKRLAAMLSEKRDKPYSKMMGWISSTWALSCYYFISFANMPGNTTLFEPIDLQSKRPSINSATLYIYIYIYTYTYFYTESLYILLYLYFIETFLITPVLFSVTKHAVTIIHHKNNSFIGQSNQEIYNHKSS